MDDLEANLMLWESRISNMLYKLEQLQQFSDDSFIQRKDADFFLLRDNLTLAKGYLNKLIGEKEEESDEE